MLFPLFVVGCLWWWLAVVVASVLLIWALDRESGFGATVVLILSIAAIESVTYGGLIWPPWMTTWPGIAACVAGYVGIGVVWGLVKWYFLVVDRLYDFKVLRKQWLTTNGLTEIPPERKQEWLEWLWDRHCDWVRWAHVVDPESGTDRNRVYTLAVKPIANENKGRITTWMAYWPWSMLWTICADLIKRAFEKIQELCSNVMQRISDWAFSDFEED